MTIRPDPPVRRDGCCVVCKKPRKRPATRYGLAEYETDPFCSTTCARAWHSNPLAAKSIWSLDHK